MPAPPRNRGHRFAAYPRCSTDAKLRTRAMDKVGAMVLLSLMLAVGLVLLGFRIRSDWRAVDSHSRAIRVIAIQVAVGLVALAVGVWHFTLGWVSMFVFRKGEPLSSWIWVYSGLLSTLPLAVLSIWKPRWAASGLLVGTVVAGSALLCASWPQLGDHMPGFLITSTGPAVMMAAGIRLVARERSHGLAKHT